LVLLRIEPFGLDGGYTAPVMDANAHRDADPLAAAVPRLRRFARVLIGSSDGADDLVLETLAAARRGHAAAIEMPIGLFGMMHASHRRHARPDGARAEAATRAANDDLCARVMRLPLEEREVLMLVAVERLSYTDVAKVVDVPVATVMATLTRARERLARTQA
jgi:RNA polymerase sigma-70 factor (ECF subfamily)